MTPVGVQPAVAVERSHKLLDGEGIAPGLPLHERIERLLAIHSDERGVLFKFALAALAMGLIGGAALASLVWMVVT